MWLQDLEAHCDELLEADRFDDYCPNGIQVEAGGRVSRLVTGVTASQALIEAAIAAGADLLLVHHGYFWKGESPAIRGLKAKRIGALISNGLSLVAYHLPLDAHGELGNNRQLAERLGIDVSEPVGDGLLWQGKPAVPVAPDRFAALIAERLDRMPLHVAAGPSSISRVAWCTGAGQGLIEQAASLGVDAYLTGEVSEPTVHLARELGIHFYAAGHHATERYGVQALGAHLAGTFGLEHIFIDIPNPA